MEDKAKLIPAITAAITAYIQMEEQSSSVSPGGEPQPKVGQGNDPQAAGANEK